MHTFFHGWRRKAGCVALVMALAMTAVWIRSRIVEDDLSFVYSDLRSRDAGIEKSVVTLNTSRYGGTEHNWVARHVHWRILYGTVAVPLTLISAYLLLVPFGSNHQPRANPMREFFRGWRRRVGCVALVMALILLAAWVRSLMMCDTIVVPRRDTLQVVQSFVGTVRWGRHSWPGGIPGAAPVPSTIGVSSKLMDKQIAESFWKHRTIEWRWNWAGFDFAAGDSDGERVERWAIPYWSLVIPLTLLSAYLILWKPRKRAS